MFADESRVNAFEKDIARHFEMLVNFGGAVIAPTANLQKCFSLSTTEAEYVTMSEAVVTAVWLRNIL